MSSSVPTAHTVINHNYHFRNYYAPILSSWKIGLVGGVVVAVFVYPVLLMVAYAYSCLKLKSKLTLLTIAAMFGAATPMLDIRYATAAKAIGGFFTHT